MGLVPIGVRNAASLWAAASVAVAGSCLELDPEYVAATAASLSETEHNTGEDGDGETLTDPSGTCSLAAAIPASAGSTLGQRVNGDTPTDSAHLSELLVFSPPPDDANRDLIESYLATKW